MQNMLTFATKAGMEIATVVEYTTEDEASIDAAVGRLKESGARYRTCPVVFKKS